MNHFLEVENLETHFPTAPDSSKPSMMSAFTLMKANCSGWSANQAAESRSRLFGDAADRAAGKDRWRFDKFKGEELTTASDERMRAIRGDDISMIFQDPMTSLNPVYTVGEQIAEALHFIGS